MMLIFHFWATFGGKMGVATTRAPNGLGLQTPLKSWPTRWTFWADHYLIFMFSKFFSGEPPLKISED